MSFPRKQPDDMAANSASAAQESDRPFGLLRRSDQAVVAGLLLLAAGGMALWWLSQAGAGGPLIDIDHAPPLKADFRVDLNQADWPELVQLPGIGPSLARRIVEYRASRGPFRCLEELEQVPGIGPKKLTQIKPYLLPLPDDRPSTPPESP